MGFENADFRIEVIDLTSKYDIKRVSDFLTPLGFEFMPHQVEYTIKLYNLNDQVLGTGSHMNGVLKFVVVAPEYRETGAFANIVTHLNDKVLSSGYKTVFVYTRPSNSIKFQGLGYNEIAVVEPFYAFLELGYSTINHYKEYLVGLKKETKTDDVAAVVVNCNPFTNGHLYLIEKAAQENEMVYLFVVEEDRSAFPFEKRFQLIQEGIAHLDNVVLVKGNKYIVSGATFPAYFLKKESVDAVERNQTELDVTVFAQHFAPILGIRKRYVGTEVYCSTTQAYNDAMKKVLPQFDIQLVEVDRKAIGSEDNYISASKVRAALAEGRLEDIKGFVPPSTYRFLQSEEAAPIIEKIRESSDRH
ncbi:MAG: [citrate (pro-3S)-lyase] ligase [bacterium]|nr:[citrate (pro-3S)-lyase] ligase [bacterium]